MAYQDSLDSAPTLEDILGIGPPPEAPADVPQEQFQATPWQRILEGLQGTQGQLGQPRGFGESFLSGLTGQLGAQGTKIAHERAKFEDRQTKRGLLLDAERKKATDDYRKLKAERIGEVRKSEAKTESDIAAEARKAIPIDPTMVERYPVLKPFLGSSMPSERLKFYTEETPAEKAVNARTRNQPGMGTDAMDIADAIRRGDQPPETTGLYRMGAPVRAELARSGYNFTKANTDWQAVKRSVATLNGPQQTRLRQAVETAYSSLDIIDQLNDQLSKDIPRGSVKIVNRATMSAAMNGAFGPKAQQTATMLNGQITDVVSELGNAYMGGNSPTDHALALAGKNLSGDWSHDQLKSMTGLARQNLSIRRNSITNAAPITPGTGALETPATGPQLTPDQKYQRYLEMVSKNKGKK